MPIYSLSVDDPKASHRVAGISDVFGSGVIAYCTRDQASDIIAHIRKVDPQANVRVEPYNPFLNGKALRSTDVEWIIHDEGHLGVKIGDQFFFMHKGDSFMPDTEHQYRLVEKREFGESGPVSLIDNHRDVGVWRTNNGLNANNELAYHNSPPDIISETSDQESIMQSAMEKLAIAADGRPFQPDIELTPEEALLLHKKLSGQ